MNRLEPKEDLRPAAKRGEISGFSWRSRNRLLDLIAKIDRDQVEVERWRFVTLTYHAQKITARQSKRHLKMLHKRARRHFGPVALLWKLEPHEKGKDQPHYHLLVMLPSSWAKDLRAEREWFAKAWTEITNDGGWDDEQYAFNVYGGDHEEEPWNRKAAWQMMHSWQEVTHYTGKYVAKVVTDRLPETFGKPGRWWGTMGWEEVPVSEVAVDLEAKATGKIQRVMRKHALSKVRGKWFIDTSGEAIHLDRDMRKLLRRGGIKLRQPTCWMQPGRSGRFLGDPWEIWRLALWAEGQWYPKRLPQVEAPF